MLVYFLLISLLIATCGSLTNKVLKNVPIPTRGLLYPFESETREIRSLDGMWRFLKSNASAPEEEWYTTDLDKFDDTIAMPVPASYNDLTTNDTLRDHVGGVWYERNFFVSHDWSVNKRVWLRFGSVHYSATVWLNGVNVLNHSIGHLPFEADVTKHLEYGVENRLTVLCNNTLTLTTIPQGEVVKHSTDWGNRTFQTYTFDFFNYAGIHRSVVLYTTPKVYIQDITITTDVTYTDEDSYGEIETGVVNYVILISGYESNELFEDSMSSTSATANGPYYLNLQLRDKMDIIVVTQICNEMPFNGTLIVKDVHLWWPYLMDPDYGYLYTLEVYLHLVDDNSLIDVYRMKVGIRSLQWNNMSLLLNGQELYLYGFGKHEDSDLRGKGLDYALLTRDFNLIKWIGANAYRTSHYPYSEESMQFADENGIMIIDECSSVNTNNFSSELMFNHKSALEQLIHRDRNHPSVIMWSIANEPRTKQVQSEPYFKDIVRYTKTLDTTRPLTASTNVAVNEDKMAQFLDIISFNRYNGWYENTGHLDMITNNITTEANNWWLRYNRPIILSEYGADTMEGLHFLPEFVWSEDYQIKLFEKHFMAFDDLRKQKWFIGEFVWNFADFKTEQKIKRVGGNKKGIFTRNRQPKMSAHLLRKRYYSLCNKLFECKVPTDFLF